MTNTDYLTTVPQTRNTQGQLKEQSVKGIHQALTLVKMMLRWVFWNREHPHEDQDPDTGLSIIHFICQWF